MNMCLSCRDYRLTFIRIYIRLKSDSNVLVLQSSKRKSVGETKDVHEKTANVVDASKRTKEQSQEKWNTGTSGRWTAKLLLDITHRMERKFGAVNCYLTQLLSGHDYFCKYLFKMGKITRPNCIYDDAEHFFFHCERWRLERRNLSADF